MLVLLALASCASEPVQHANPLPDDLPQGTLVRLGANVFRPGAAVSAVAILPDASSLVSAAGESIHIWNARNGRVVGTMQCPARVATVGVSPDGCLIAWGARDGKIRIHERATGRLLMEQACGDNGVRAIAFSPDGRKVAFGDGSGTVALLPLSGGAPRVLGVHHSVGPDGLPAIGVWSLAFLLNGQLVSAGADGYIRVWDLDSADEVVALTGHRGPVFAITVSNDGKRLASAGEDGSVRIWDLKTGREVSRCDAHQPRAFTAAWEPDGVRVASSGDDGHIRIWDSSTGKALWTLKGHIGAVPSMAWSPCGKQLITGGADGTIRFWDTGTGCELRPTVAIPIALAFQKRAGDGLLAAEWDGQLVRWNLHSRERVVLARHNVLRRAEFSLGGRFGLSADEQGTIRCWEARTGGERYRIALAANAGTALAQSPDGEAAIADEEFSIRCLDASGRELRRLVGHRERVQAMAFSPAHSILASASVDGEVILWRLDDAQIGARIRNPAGGLYDVCFTADGRLLVGVGRLRSIFIVEVASGTAVGTLSSHGESRNIAAIPGGPRVVIGGESGAVWLWNVLLQRSEGAAEAGSSAIVALTVSEDGRRAASAHFDGLISVWDFPPVPEPLKTRSGPESHLWKQLAQPDASLAWPAIIAASKGGSEIAERLGQGLETRITMAGLRNLVANLDADDIDERTKAKRDFDSLGFEAEAYLEKVERDESFSQNIRAMVSSKRATLRGPVYESAECRRRIRAIQLLGVIRVPEAETILRRLAETSPSVTERREAIVTLKANSRGNLLGDKRAREKSDR